MNKNLLVLLALLGKSVALLRSVSAKRDCIEMIRVFVSSLINARIDPDVTKTKSGPSAVISARSQTVVHSTRNVASRFVLRKIINLFNF